MSRMLMASMVRVQMQWLVGGKKRVEVVVVVVALGGRGS